MSAYASLATPDTVRIERTLPGPIERVWNHLVDADKRGLWLARGPLDARTDGRVELIFHNSTLTGHDDPPPAKYANEDSSTLRGRVLACEAPHLLAFTWGDGDDASQVRFELTQAGADVHLRVTHSRLMTHDAIVSVSGGWHAHLDILADRLAGRAPEAFWPANGRLEAEYEQRMP